MAPAEGGGSLDLKYDFSTKKKGVIA